MIFSVEGIFWLILLFLVPGLVAFVYIRLPHKIVQFQGKFYQKIYQDMLGMNSEEIDVRYQLPSDKFFMGSRSDFIPNAPETPEKYVRMIRFYRKIGYFILALLLLTLGLLLIGILGGGITI